MALLCAIPRPASAVQTIPFSVVNNGLIQVQGSIDDQPPVPMLVNTGAGVDVLSSELGRRYVAINGKYVSLRLTGERVDLPIGKVVTFAAGGVPIEAPYVGVWKGLDATGVDGLIAATAFRTITTTFDFRNHQLVIEDAQTFPNRVRTDTRIPAVSKTISEYRLRSSRDLISVMGRPDSARSIPARRASPSTRRSRRRSASTRAARRAGSLRSRSSARRKRRSRRRRFGTPT